MRRSGRAFIRGQPLDRGGTRSCADTVSRHRSGVSPGHGAYLAESGVTSSGAIVEARFGVSGARRARGGSCGGGGGGVSRRRRAAPAGALRMAADFYEVGD